MPSRRRHAPSRSAAVAVLSALVASAALPACSATPLPTEKPAAPAAAAPADTPPTPEVRPTPPAPAAAAPQRPSVTLTAEDRAAFTRWKADMRAEAQARGLSARALAALDAAQLQPRVLELDRSQPEFTQTFWGYLGRAVNDRRVEEGRALMQRHADLLAGLEVRYGVPGRFLVAFWGMETNYGSNFGGFPVVDALATLAWDARRSAFFRNELLAALRIIDGGHIEPQRMVGSWAGAMGHMQFMPTTFAAHATDATGDGRIDIWGSLPDALASAAKYLSDIGWKRDQTWGREVSLPPGFDYSVADGQTRKSLQEWAALGIGRSDGGGPLPVVEGMQATLILPGGARGPAFLVYDNFNAIMTWNRSVLYAVAVGHLADRIAGMPPLATPRPTDDRPLSRDEVMRLQALLNSAGFDAGQPDGLVGSGTRGALRAFQRAAGLPPDGYPTPQVLAALEGWGGARGGQTQGQ
ncbi:lytic murein transglycosylase [Caenispirillum bisanense]|uniref:lytic murein transglycosylase n=1 Tax=Caenispirillum bisanense TaxID=414052 RepID=UPI0031D5C7BE